MYLSPALRHGLRNVFVQRHPVTAACRGIIIISCQKGKKLKEKETVKYEMYLYSDRFMCLIGFVISLCTSQQQQGTSWGTALGTIDTQEVIHDLSLRSCAVHSVYSKGLRPVLKHWGTHWIIGGLFNTDNCVQETGTKADALHDLEPV